MTTGALIVHPVLPLVEPLIRSLAFPSDPPFHIAQTSTGEGAVATRPIRAGQLLFVENEPLVIQPENASEQSILASLCHLPPARSQAFFTLSTSFDRKTPIRDIFQTNALPLGPCLPVSSSDPDMAYGVFTTLSRLNNSCTPNAAATWNDVTQCMSLHALRPISKNEELTISYGQPLFATRAERHSYLKRTRGFDCICAACRTIDPSSDARREELKRLFTSIPFVPDPATGVKMVRILPHSAHG
jgi:SET domain